MRNLLWTQNALINLDNVVTIGPDTDDPTKTKIMSPGIVTTLDMPYEETKALIEKMIRDQYEYDMKVWAAGNMRRLADMKEVMEPFLNGHNHA